MKLNKTWHRANPMPKNANEDQRLAWHVDHARHCGCRDIPEKLKEVMKSRKILIPKRKKE